MYDVMLELRDLLETSLNTAFNGYWIGRVETIPINYLPILMIYPDTTEMVNPLTTCKDRYHHTVKIEIVTSAFGKVANAEDVIKVQRAQKELWDKMEERDNNGTPKATTILGVLRRNIKGTSFLFSDNILIDYPNEPKKIENNTYFRAVLTMTVHREFNLRS